METTTTGTDKALGADAEINVEQIDDHNREVTVAIHHLAPPERIEKGMTVYVLWIIPEGQQAVREAVVSYDADERYGEAHAHTPNKKFEVRVTAEKSPSAHSPSTHTVVSKKVSF